MITPAISSDVAMGRWMKGSEMFTRSWPPIAEFVAVLPPPRLSPPARSTTFEPSCSLYWPSTTTRSPAVRPGSISVPFQ